MNAFLFGSVFTQAAAHLAPVALCSARLAPVTLLCPVFGGVQAPVLVRLSVALVLALSVHLAGGVQAPLSEDALAFAGLATRELVLGVTIGLLAALPFDAARMGGRFIDLFRGTSAEAALPMVGSRESASGDLLFQLLLGIASTGVGSPVLVSALWRSFALVRLGVHLPTESVAMAVSTLVGSAFATGLAIGAPLAAACFAADCALAFVSRAAPSLHLQEVGTPTRILAGGAVLWVGIAIFMDRLTGALLPIGEQLVDVLRSAR